MFSLGLFCFYLKAFSAPGSYPGHSHVFSPTFLEAYQAGIASQTSLVFEELDSFEEGCSGIL